MNNFQEESVTSLFSGDYFCDKCGRRMVFEDDERNILVCLSCGNSTTLDAYLHWNDFDFVFETEDEAPEGCSACGGPYPECTTSCPLFDD